ncbi:protein SMALL AUXIN UP-REGULATED RNA 12-like [Cryptomeria japonica]|uniref:protein SMALL AUXIN UP-REGULATED RNA 12-like n=1 Tax=Cryptomeria japonica TaxID=3369 RepID=UPI0027DA7F37|nr:protein SMALL AUXIN UP-REGULATED RNA 12-like [Cryptomeria japonica]
MGGDTRNKIALAVLLKKFVTKLQRLVNASREVCCAPSPRIRCEEKVGFLPRDVPKGHFAVYVGSQRSRFVVPTTYLSQPLFQTLLERAEEEYGFDHHMGLIIPCEKVAFENITALLEREDPTLDCWGINKIMGFFHNANPCMATTF